MLKSATGAKLLHVPYKGAALLEMVTEDCVFETSNGPHPHGARHVGHEQLAAAFPRIWEAFPDARWEDATHVECGERGFSEWTFRGTSLAGKRVEMRGVDLFVFRDGKICRKDTFRKSQIELHSTKD
jgi:ketosteroid isomerase-like protein